MQPVVAMRSVNYIAGGNIVGMLQVLTRTLWYRG